MSVYTIKVGDSLGKIAHQHAVSVERILSLNPRIRNKNLIFPGQVIVIPASTDASGRSEATASQTYTVKSGDSLDRIARHHNVTVEQILLDNPQIKNKNLIHPGQSITIRRVNGPGPAAGVEREVALVHKRANGESLLGIAEQYGLSLQELVSVNGATAGMLLAIPKLKPRKEDTNTDKLHFGAKVSKTFRNKVREVSKRLDINPNYLMAVIAFESGETFSASIKNAAGSGAVGLIQFMPSTAKGLKTTTSALAKMTPEKQLDYVEKYFQPYKGKIKSIEDLYMAVLWPAAIGKKDSYVLFKVGTKAYQQNKGLDTDSDGNITKFEAAAKVRAKLRRGEKFAL